MVVVAAVIIGYQKVLAWWAFRNRRFESLVLDDLSILVADGQLQLEALEAGVLSRTQLLARLRQEGIANLGTVERFYQEANGSFSLIRFEEPRPGLSILPTRDTAFRQEQKKAPGQFACASCANVVPSPQQPAHECPRCRERQWQPAVLG